MKAKQFYLLAYASFSAILLYQVIATLLVSSQVVAYGSTLADLEKQRTQLVTDQNQLAQTVRQLQRPQALEDQAQVLGFQPPDAAHVLRP
jgi:cell division protein FtsB